MNPAWQDNHFYNKKFLHSLHHRNITFMAIFCLNFHTYFSLYVRLFEWCFIAFRLSIYLSIVILAGLSIYLLI
jgi:hypothetical protein